MSSPSLSSPKGEKVPLQSSGSSSSLALAIVPDKEGTLLLTTKKAKIQQLVKLYGGSLYGFYGIDGSQAQKIKWVIHLQDAKLDVKGDTLVLRHLTKDYIFSSPDAAVFAEWSKALRAGSTLVPFHLPREQKGIMFRTKRSFAESSMGTAIIKQVIDKPAKKLLRTVRKVLAFVTNSSSQAREVETNSIKLVVKGYFLWESGKIHPNDVANIESLSRRALKSLLIVMLNHHKIKNNEKKRDELVTERLRESLVLIEQAGAEIKRVLRPHVPQKDIDRVDAIYRCLNSVDMLKVALNEKQIAGYLDYLCEEIRDYLGWDASGCDNVTLLFGIPKGGFGF